MRKICSILFSAVIGLCLSLNRAEAKLFNASEFYLDNGMQVIVVENHKAPIVKHMVWYKSGAIDEPLGKGGSAHLLEHLMFRGTSKVPGNRLNRVLEQNGADSNAFTGQDYTAYHQLLDISRLELAMFLEADRMANLKLSSEDFDKERAIVFQERKQVVENNPTSYFGESLRRSLWQEHPYGRPITGLPDEIMALRQEDVQEFYNRYYAPNNAVLVLSGDITFSEAKNLAQKYYGNVKPKNIGERVNPPKLPKNFKSKLEMKLPGVANPRVSINYAAPSYNFDRNNIYDLLVFAKYLGDGPTSELYRKLVIEKKQALAVSTSYDFLARSYGTFSISALPVPGINPQKLAEELMQAVKESIQQLTPQKIAKIKKKMLVGLVYLKDNPGDAAYIAGSMAAVGMPLTEIENYAGNISAVTAPGVRKAAENLLRSAPRITGILEPSTEEK